jgi:energy-coupling factor transporter ATP-binding protein EcfA2
VPPVLKVLSVTTTAGLLKDVPIDFLPGLNCVIGDPGSGKSTCVETLRFVFNRDPKWVNMLLGLREPDYGPNHPEFGHLRATLAGGTAICRIEVDYGSSTEILRIERNASDHAPRVYRDGTDEPGDASVLECMEIYSQGDLQRIAEDTRRRLTLLERRERVALESLRRQVCVCADDLREIDVEVDVTQEIVEGQDTQLTHLNESRERLTFLIGRRPAMSPELQVERESYDRRRHQLETLETLEDYRMKRLPHLAEALRGEAHVREALGGLSDYDFPEAREIEGVYAPFASLLQSTGTQAQLQKGIAGRPLIQKLRARFEELDRPYHKLQEQQQQVAAAHREEDTVRHEVQRLEKIEAERKKNGEKLAELKARREGLREKVRRLASQIFKIRDRLVREINEQFRDLVKLELREGIYSPPEYRNAILDMIKGSGFKNQEQLADDLAKVPPPELIAATEDRDPKFLSEYLGRDRTQMQRLVDHLDQKVGRGIYALEKFVFDDDLEIFLKHNGQWKPIRELSRGRKALALLPIILMDGTDPLVADQLEDAINNRLIMQTLVARSQGLTRQLILVTHNANIALLTKADRVIVLEDEGDHVHALAATINEDGTRHVLDLLEGGSDAFKRRTELYGDLLDGEEPSDDPRST